MWKPNIFLRLTLPVALAVGFTAVAAQTGASSVPGTPFVPEVAAASKTYAASKTTVPSKEAFLNQVFRTTVDTGFSSYLLVQNAYPSQFLKFDYDEWVKYALRDDVPIYVLNELAAKSFADREPCSWRSDSLVHALCIGEGAADSVLSKTWRSLPPEQRIVFYFSRPLFTDDGNYAILDMGYRCDDRLCGMGSTCLFKRTATGWWLAGRKQNW